jgi:hypothetical protein
MISYVPNSSRRDARIISAQELQCTSMGRTIGSIKRFNFGGLISSLFGERSTAGGMLMATLLRSADVYRGEIHRPGWAGEE